MLELIIFTAYAYKRAKVRLSDDITLLHCSYFDHVFFFTSDNNFIRFLRTHALKIFTWKNIIRLYSCLAIKSLAPSVVITMI